MMGHHEARVGITTRVVGLAVSGGGLLIFLLVRWYGAAERGGWIPLWWLILFSGLGLLWAGIIRWQVVRPILGFSSRKRWDPEETPDAPREDLPAELTALERSLCDVLSQARACSEGEKRVGAVMRTLVDTLGARGDSLREETEMQARRLEEGLVEFRSLGDHLGQLEAHVHQLGSRSEEMQKTNGVLEDILGRGRGLWKEIGKLSSDVLKKHQQVSDALDDSSSHASVLERSARAAVSLLSPVSEQVRQVTANVREIERSTGDLNRVAADGGRVVREVNRHSQDTTQAVLESAEIVRNLGSRSQEIGAVVEVIESIADETNLLALNAAIIAAQAGEHGKSFAVVADEIRELAERTSSSTREVAELVKDVRDGIGQASQSIQQSADKVHQSADLADQAREIWEDVRTGCEKNARLAETIVFSSSEQCRAVDNLGKAVEEVAAAVEGVSKKFLVQRDNQGRAAQGLGRLQAAAEECRELEPTSSNLVRELASKTREIRELLKSVAEACSTETWLAEGMANRMREAKECALQQLEALREQGDMLRSAGREDGDLPQETSGSVLLAKGVKS